MKITIDIPARLARDIPARLARDIIAQAHSHYWLCNYSHRLRGDGNGLYIGKPVKGGEAATGTPVPTPRAYVGAKAIAEGLRIMLDPANPEPSGNAPLIAARILKGTNDGQDADVLLQYAAYGQLVWG